MRVVLRSQPRNESPGLAAKLFDAGGGDAKDLLGNIFDIVVAHASADAPVADQGAVERHHGPPRLGVVVPKAL